MLGGQILIGVGMATVTVVIHTMGLIGIVSCLRYFDFRAIQPGNHVRSIVFLVFVISGILVLHTVEVWGWAALYLMLDQFETLERALYFSNVTFTTLGYGDIVVDERWQFLSSIEAANGIVLFGVSTAFVFAVMRTLFESAEIVRAGF